MSDHKNKTVHFAIKGRKGLLSILNFRQNGEPGHTGILTIFNEDPKKLTPSIEIVGISVNEIIAEAILIYEKKCGPVTLEDFKPTEIR